MNLQEFIELLKEKVSDILGPEYEIDSRRIEKNNSIEYDCLSISHDNCNISPNIYVNSMFLEYKNGHSIDALAQWAVKQYRECLKSIDDTNCMFLNTENAEEKVILRLVNYAKNKKMLAKCPHDKVRDLAVTYHFVLSNDSEKGISTFRIDYENLKYLNLTEESIRECACKNTERLFPAIFERVEYLVKSGIESGLIPSGHKIPFFDGIPMYLLTTASGLNGAGCLLYDGMLERIRKSIGSDYYIIPSSINEIIIVPEDIGMGEDVLNDMLRSVNAEAVPDAEVLSENVYRYPQDTFKISVHRKQS